MSLQLVLGPSGSGKSRYVFDMALKCAEVGLKEKVFIIVPDQFTMQTQRDLVSMTPGGGIMNIDVLSFSRLSHRILEETGDGRLPVLDDTGKNLILRQCAAKLGDNIPYFKGKLNRPGFIHEIKSAISEFMQYDLDEEGVGRLIAYADDNGKRNLSAKLTDLNKIYGAFRGYIRDSYITTEESMDVLASAIYKSHILCGSTVIIDGFTGFTPVQNKVVLALLKVAKKVVITLTNDSYSSVTDTVNRPNLFLLTDKSLLCLEKMCREEDIPLEERVILQGDLRHGDGSPLEHLERNLYRYPPVSYRAGIQQDIRIDRCENIRDEVHLLVRHIRELLRDENAYYRDIAVITGDLLSYRSEIEDAFDRYDIPVFIDENRGLVHNPFVEYVKSSLNLFRENFSYESVMRYLRCGFTGILRENIDLLEPYIRETGIRGISEYSRHFNKTTRRMGAVNLDTEAYEETFAALDAVRCDMMDGLKPLLEAGIGKSSSVSVNSYVEALYAFLELNRAADRLDEYAAYFRDQGDYTRAKEYDQIYRSAMELFEQIHSLVGDEEMNIKDFTGILEAGFDEISLGTIPQSVDRIIVGDMERTRLKPVKYLFFLGLNDGSVPKSGNKGGIISDMEREFLTGSGEELAPSPKQQLYIGRFYLYSNLTKPSHRLYMSYAMSDNMGKDLHPSSIVRELNGIFPGIDRECITEIGIDSLESMSDVKSMYSELIRRMADNTASAEDKKNLGLLTGALKDDRDFIEQAINNAYFRYEGRNLNPKVAALLYGDIMRASISRMEQYAQCAYAYFITYGLGIREDNEYGITNIDLGTIYHNVLQVFISGLEEKGLDWSDFTEEDAEDIINKAIDQVTAGYSNALFRDRPSSRYVYERMKKVLKKTVNVLSYQLKKGEYRPTQYEYEFSRVDSLDCINVALNKEEKIRLSGKIDRVDICERDDRVYVKIVDYKSGNKDFSLCSFYHGLQLQMVVYMGEALNKAGQVYRDKDAHPAAILYYHIDDPVVDGGDLDSDEAVNSKVRRALRAKGLVNDDGDILHSLDTSDEADSDVIPVKRKKDGTFYKSASIIGEEDMMLLTRYADHKLKTIGREILEGRIDTNPIILSKTSFDSCKHCKYKGMCGFNDAVKGYRKQVYEDADELKLLDSMRAELGEGGRDSE